MGIAVKGLDTTGNREAGVNEDRVFQSASLIKLLVLAELLREVDEGVISLDDQLGGSTIRELAESMIEVSDNHSANLLINRLGFDSINAQARRLGLHQTYLSRRMLDFEARARGEDNYTSVSDMVTLLSKIWRGTFLSPSSRRFALNILENQQRNTKLPVGLPSGARVLHKTGKLPGIEHDVGIVILPNGRAFSIAVMTQGDNSSGISAIHKAAAVSYQAFL